MKTRLFFLVGFVLIGSFSCVRKELPEPTVSAPIFSVNGWLNGQPFMMVAGQNGYFADAAFQQDDGGYYHFTGEIKKYNCPQCPGRFSLRLTSNEAFNHGQAPQEDQALPLQQYDFQLTSPGNAFLNYQFFSSPSPASFYNWSFGDGEHSSDPNPQHTYETPGPKDVSLNMGNVGGCSSSSSMTIFAGSDQPCSAPFAIDENGGGNGNFHIFFPDELPNGLSLVAWTIDFNSDFPVTNELNVNLNWEPAHTICASFFNSILNTSGEYCVTFFSPGPPCAPSIHAQPVAEPALPGSVIIEYESEDGTVYSSASPMNNNPNHFFEVTEVAGYDATVGGNATRRVHIRFTSSLISTDGNESMIEFENVEAYMLFSIPE
ncbi:MAG: hypothetical protein IT223_06425 [Crocinitomicaceae bacterium]|nr:hypothetical protein [Crocinitomicaceae bacterium]